MELSKEFRANAADCLNLSHQANSTGSRAHWVAMAQFWFQLAQHVEDREEIDAIVPSVSDGPNDRTRRKPSRPSPNST